MKCQDAMECWTNLLGVLSKSLISSNARNNVNVVESLLRIELTSRLYCQESGEESTEIDFIYALKCHISKDVNLLQEGLKIGLNSQRVKNSHALRRNAVYVEEPCVSGLPRYLTIHFLRFEWKGDSNKKILQLIIHWNGMFLICARMSFNQS